MLLYTQIDDDPVMKKTYRMSGNQVTVRTLDLNLDFSSVRKQLDSIVDEYFPSAEQRKDPD
jgi:5-methylcytosine-specific restriction enzyme subunit McrC